MNTQDSMLLMMMMMIKLFGHRRHLKVAVGLIGGNHA
jgi:hypothetical protein